MKKKIPEPESTQISPKLQSYRSLPWDGVVECKISTYPKIDKQSKKNILYVMLFFAGTKKIQKNSLVSTKLFEMTVAMAVSQ